MSNQRTRATCRWGFSLYALGLGFMVLVPSGSVPSTGVGTVADLLGRLGMPASMLEPTRFEFAANTVVVVPLVVLGAVVWPRLGWRDWTALAFVTAFAVETVQWLLLPDRSASTIDVVANTLGRLVGGVLGRWAVARLLPTTADADRREGRHGSAMRQR